MDFVKQVIDEINGVVNQLDFLKKSIVNNLQNPLSQLVDYVARLEQENAMLKARVEELEKKVQEKKKD